MRTQNPFRPTFGAAPLYWAGRQQALDNYAASISGKASIANRSVLISGSRGIGKTVLLGELEEIAKTKGWLVVRISSASGITKRLIQSDIPRALIELRGTQSRNRISSIGINALGTVTTEIEREPEPLPTLVSSLRRLADELSAHRTGFVLSIDEVQDCNPDELRELAHAYQDLIRDDYDVSILMAGLTDGVDKLLNLPGTTFLRRARHYELGPLSLADSNRTFVETTRSTTPRFIPAAAEQGADFAEGYPYLVQLLGALAWERARQRESDDVAVDDISAVLPDAISQMGTNVHQPSIKNLPIRQLDFLQAMAAVMGPDGTARTAEIAELLEKDISGVSDSRQKLIARDLIEPAGWGKLQFVLPYLKDYLQTGQRKVRLQ